VAGPATWSSEQILDPPLQDIIGWQPDRVAHPAAFQGLVETSLSSWRRLVTNSESWKESPVMFPPGRAKLVTNPSSTGS
jgi:hypothetical protein